MSTTPPKQQNPVGGLGRPKKSSTEKRSTSIAKAARRRVTSSRRQRDARLTKVIGQANVKRWTMMRDRLTGDRDDTMNDAFFARILMDRFVSYNFGKA